MHFVSTYFCLQKKRNPSYFRNLRDSYHILFGFLCKGNEAECKSEPIEKLEALLRLHSMDTADLIHEYYLERCREVGEIKEELEGVLTVKLIFINDVLKVDILNANNIKAMDSNGMCLKIMTCSKIPTGQQVQNLFHALPKF